MVQRSTGMEKRDVDLYPSGRKSPKERTGEFTLEEGCQEWGGPTSQKTSREQKNRRSE